MYLKCKEIGIQYTQGMETVYVYGFKALLIEWIPVAIILTATKSLSSIQSHLDVLRLTSSKSTRAFSSLAHG